MKEQHSLIKGYRDLSQDEIDLMNRIKAHAEETQALVIAVRAVVTPAVPALEAVIDDESHEMVTGAIYFGHDDGPFRWICLADDHLQQGFMALTRAVAQPTTY